MRKYPLQGIWIGYFWRRACADGGTPHGTDSHNGTASRSNIITRNSFRHNKLNPDPDTCRESDPVRDDLDSKSSTIICENTMEIEEGNFSGSTTPRSGENLSAGKSAAGRPSLNAETHTTDDDNMSFSGIG